MKKCNGFPWKTPCDNEANTRAGVWCKACDDKRKNHITASLAPVAKALGMDWPEVQQEE